MLVCLSLDVCGLWFYTLEAAYEELCYEMSYYILLRATGCLQSWPRQSHLGCGNRGPSHQVKNCCPGNNISRSVAEVYLTDPGSGSSGQVQVQRGEAELDLDLT